MRPRTHNKDDYTAGADICVTTAGADIDLFTDKCSFLGDHVCLERNDLHLAQDEAIDTLSFCS